MKETLEELKEQTIKAMFLPYQNDEDCLWDRLISKKEILSLIDTAYNLGKAESTSEAVKQERERIVELLDSVDLTFSRTLPNMEGEESYKYVHEILEGLKQQIGE